MYQHALITMTQETAKVTKGSGAEEACSLIGSSSHDSSAWSGPAPVNAQWAQ